MRQVSLREFRTRGAKALDAVPRGETVLLSGQRAPYFLVPVQGDVILADGLRRAMARRACARAGGWLKKQVWTGYRCRIRCRDRCGTRRSQTAQGQVNVAGGIGHERDRLGGYPGWRVARATDCRVGSRGAGADVTAVYCE